MSDPEDRTLKAISSLSPDQRRCRGEGGLLIMTLSAVEASSTSSSSFRSLVAAPAPLLPPPPTMSFLPDFTEHPKPKRQKTKVVRPSQQPQPLQLNPPADGGEEDEGEGEVEVTFLQDLVAGGMAGSASVIVGHPLDTLKVRVQNSASSSASSSSSLAASIAEFGGLSSLFRGMGAPLSAAAVVNAIVFSSYGLGSRMYDCYVPASASFSSPSSSSSHDPWQKSMTCGAFAGLVQCAVICPMEHVKCRLQVQHDGPGGYRGPYHAARSIAKDHGLRRLYQGWWSTVSREVPAFGLYFAVYDYMKDNVNTWLARQEQQRHQQPAFRTAGIDRTSAATMTAAAVSPAPETPSSAVRHTHTWMASACAGGIAGSVTWGVVYPVDVIKTKIQTSPLDTPLRNLSMYRVGASIVAKHGWRRLFRGLGITLVRAFPVNGTIFPVYEFTLIQINRFSSEG